MHATEARPVEDALALPPAPPADRLASVPWLASFAPVVGAMALWVLTGSPFALAFAALGPVVALASIVDGRRQAAKARRLHAAERGVALSALQVEVDRRHARERALAWQRTPAARHVLDEVAGSSWHPGRPRAVVLGQGDEASTLRVTGTPADETDRSLVREAALLRAAPVLADPSAGIGFVGPAALARAAARAALVQLAHQMTPGTAAIRVPGSSGWAWAGRLPHRSGEPGVVVLDAWDDESSAAVSAATGAPTGAPTPATAAGVAGAESPVQRLAVAASVDLLPPGLSTVLRVESPARALLERWNGHAEHRELTPDLLSTADAGAWAVAALEAAMRAGLTADATAIPRKVAFDSLGQPAARRFERSTLAVHVGVGAAGPVLVDLVRDGPHALVAGTSGSGKSEFLLAWLAALAASHPPELVALLLVDFKGGAAFEPMRGWPHVAGIVTDLDEAEAVRAMQSLRAELRHREEVLRGAGARDIGALPAGVVLPRLVIVIDEFQAMVERFPDLAPLIGDIASRGRSLGVHLVLAAQRPNGVVRENVTANCGLRVSLRVLHRADSLAVLGVEDAAGLDAATPGRAILARDGETVQFQSALVSVGELERRRCAAAGAPVRRPWLDPLPERLDPAELAGAGLVSARDGAVVFGLVDEPERQRRSLAGWSPDADGAVLVVGATGSGRTTALAAFAHGFAAQHGEHAVTVLGGPPSTEWDLVHDELARVRRGGRRHALLIVDDLDVRYRAWPEEHRTAVVEAFAALVREGRATGLHVAASAISRLALPLAVRESFAAGVHLRHGSRAELVQAGGVGELWRADDPPGSGQWRGRRVQVVLVDGPRPPAVRDAPQFPLDRAAPIAVVSAAPAIDAASLSERACREVLILRPGSDAAVRAISAVGAGGAPIVVGDADTWAASWTLLAAIRERGALVVHAGPAEFKAVTRDRTPPPMLDPGGGQCWWLAPGEPVRRFAWPSSDDDVRNPQRSDRNGADSVPHVPRI